MQKMIIFFLCTIGGAVGWAIGDYLANNMLFSFLLSGVGSAVGIYYGWKISVDL